MSAKHWWYDADKENLCTRGKPLPAPLCPPQIASGLAGFFNFKQSLYIPRWAGMAQTVWRLAMSWTVLESNSAGGEIFRTRPDLSWGPSNLL